MALGIPLSILLVVITIVFHYEVLRHLSVRLPHMHIAVRFRVLTVVLICFAAHIIEIWFYAFAYAAFHWLGWGAIEGGVDGHFTDYLYFSLTSFSTLGFGDIVPKGALRVVAGTEALNGLFLVAWSTSFTYLAMERMWPLQSGSVASGGPKRDRDARK